MAHLEQWRGYADFYQSSPYAVFPQQHRVSPGRLPFTMIEVEQADHDFPDPSVSDTILALPLEVSSGNAWAWDMGEGWHYESALPGRMLVLPPDNASRWEVKGRRKLLLLALPSATIHTVLGACAPANLTQAFMPLATASWRDPLLQSLMLRLWQGMANRHASDGLLSDAAVTTLIVHLLQRAGTLDRAAEPVALAAWRLKRVLDHVDSHLHEDLDMSGLAAVAGLSVRHFTRGFAAEMGQTPHRWLMQRRVDRACELLKRSVELTQIAEECGFAGPSHFSRVFKQRVGHSPKQWLNRQRLG